MVVLGSQKRLGQDGTLDAFGAQLFASQRLGFHAVGLATAAAAMEPPRFPWRTATVVVTLTNVGTFTVPWAARSNTSWLSLAPGTGSSSAGSQGQMTFTISPGNLAPGTYTGGYTFASLTRALEWPVVKLGVNVSGSVDLRCAN